MYIPAQYAYASCGGDKENLSGYSDNIYGSITVPEEAEDSSHRENATWLRLAVRFLADAHWAKKAKAGKRVVPV